MTGPRDYPDTGVGAIRLLREVADLPAGALNNAGAEPDPHIPGCWLVTLYTDAPKSERWWRAIVYVGGHPAAPDFEVVDDDA